MLAGDVGGRCWRAMLAGDGRGLGGAPPAISPQPAESDRRAGGGPLAASGTVK